jgi:hypothetical protein
MDPGKIQELGEKMRRVLTKYPDADPDTVWHTLLNLEKDPGEHLQRLLQLGKHSLFAKRPLRPWGGA